jgi:hypothetical protein
LIAIQAVDGHGAIDAEFAEVLPSLLHVCRVGVEAVDQIAVTGPQGRGQPAVTAADVNHEAALDAGIRQDSCGPCVRRFSRGLVGRFECAGEEQGDKRRPADGANQQRIHHGSCSFSDFPSKTRG